MKKTRMLVATVTIVLGMCTTTTVHAELPKNLNGSIMIGNQVFSNDYVEANVSLINQRLMSNLDSMFFIDNEGNAQDMFTGNRVSESDIISKVGSVLTSLDGQGNSTIYVADDDNKYVDTNLSQNPKEGSIVLDINYKNFANYKNVNLVTIKAKDIIGVNDAAYYTISEGEPDINNIISLNDTMTYLNSNDALKRITIYDKDKNAVMYGEFQFNFDNNASTITQPVKLKSTKYNSGQVPYSLGNAPGNITNNGFSTVDKDKKWIYYSNPADKNRLYKRSVSGIEDYIISEDSAKYINVVGDWVYYSNYNDSGAMYKVRTDGTGRQKITDDMVSCINVVEDNIYYINHSDSAKIYLIDNKGEKKALTSHAAKDLNLVGKSIFYSNISDGNKLYTLKLNDPSLTPTKLSEVSANCINVVSETNIYYVSSDGKLYNNRNNPETNYPIEVVSNIPKKGNSNDITPTQEKMSNILVDEGGNIYYKSYADKGKLYKADIYGNGYKICDDSVDFINLINTDETNLSMDKGYVYYMKGNKLSRIPLDAEGVSKGETIKKPSLNGKVSKVQNFPLITVDDLEKFTFPERVSAIMSDGSIKELVVNWNKEKPSIKDGIYTYTGYILGYGNKVTLQISVGSEIVNINDVEIKNLQGKSDYIKISNLEPGDIIKVYDSEDANAKPKSGKASKEGIVLIEGLNLKAEGGNLYITLTKPNRRESEKIVIPYQADAPIDISIKENKGTLNDNIDIYYEATPVWSNVAGSEVDAVLQRLELPKEISDLKSGWDENKVGAAKQYDLANKWNAAMLEDNDPNNDDPFKFNDGFENASKIPMNDGQCIKQDGLYKLTVRVKNKDTGMFVPNVKYFIVDRTEGASTPIHMLDASGKDGGILVNEGTYKEITPLIKGNEKVNISAEVKVNDGKYTQVPLEEVKIQSDETGKYYKGSKIDINGSYTFKVITTNILNGAVDDAKSTVTFKINHDADISDAPNVNLEFVEGKLQLVAGADEDITVMQYNVGNGWQNIISADKTRFILPDEHVADIFRSKEISIRIPEMGGNSSSQVKVIKLKEQPDKPKGLKVDLKSENNNDDQITIIFSGSELDKCEYSVDGGNKWIDPITVQTVDAKKLVEYGDVLVRKKAYTESGTIYAPSEGIKMGLRANGNAPADIIFDVADSSLKGLNNTMEYSLDNGETWTLSTGTEEIKLDLNKVNPDKDIMIRYKANGIYLPSKPCIIDIKSAETISEYSVKKGQGIGTSNIIYSPTSGNNLKIVVGNKSEGIKVPLYEQKIDSNYNGYDVIDYKSGQDINILEARTHIGIFEVNSKGQVVKFVDRVIAEDEIRDATSIPNVKLELVNGKFQLVAGANYDIKMMQYNTGSGWKKITGDDEKRFTLPEQHVNEMFKNKKISIRIPATAENPKSQTKVIELKSQTNKPVGLKVNLKSANKDEDKITVAFTGNDLDKCEYSVDGGKKWISPSTEQAVDGKDLSKYKYILVRNKAYMNKNGAIYAPSETVKIALKVNTNVPKGITFNLAGNNLNLKGLGGNMEYSLDGGVKWTKAPANSEQLLISVYKVNPAKNILVRYRANGMNLPSTSCTVDVKAPKTISGHTVKPGNKVGTTKINYSPAAGNTLKIIIGDNTNKIKVPLNEQKIGSDYNGYTVYNYKSGNDIAVSMGKGQHIGLCEVNSKGQIIKFLDRVIAESEIKK